MDASREPKRIMKPPMSSLKKKWTNIDKKVAFTLFSLHFLCIFAPFQINWGAILISFTLYIITGLFGITISYHRNLSHKSFKIPKWLEYLFAYCGVHASQVSDFDTLSKTYQDMSCFFNIFNNFYNFRAIQSIG